MITSNKTNRRFQGIAISMMVMSLVTLNLTGQKSFNENSFAFLNKHFYTNSKTEIINAVYKVKVSHNELEAESLELEDWMLSPAEWNASESEAYFEKFDLEESEMIMEDWMKNPSEWTSETNEGLVEYLNFEENEMILEDWMMKTNWSDHSIIEEELQIEEWMSNPAGWNSIN